MEAVSVRKKDIIKSVFLTSLLMVGSCGNQSVYAAVSGKDYQSCFKTGEKAYAAADFSLAAENFAQALKFRPDDLRSRFKYAQALYSLNKYDESCNHFETLLRNSPNNIIARVYLAENYLQLGKNDAAREQANIVLRINPNHKRANEIIDAINNNKSLPINKPTKAIVIEAKQNNQKVQEIKSNTSEQTVMFEEAKPLEQLNNEDVTIEVKPVWVPDPDEIEKESKPKEKIKTAKQELSASKSNTDEIKKAEEAKKAAEAKITEEAKKAAELKKAEEAQKAAEAKIAEEAKKAAELKKAEEAQKAAEAKIAEEAKKAAELKKAEEAQKAAEAKIAEEAKKAAELKKAEEAQKAAEAKIAEEAKKAAEKKKAEEAKKGIELKTPPTAPKLTTPKMPPKASDNQKTEAIVDENTVFTPYVSGQRRSAQRAAYSKPVMPAAKTDIKSTDMRSFFEAGKSSFIVNLEKARYEIERGDIKAASKSIDLAEKLAKASDSGKNMLEAQIFKSLVLVYKCEFTEFGKHLMTLKSALAPDSYQSFLDVYSQADGLKDINDQRRLAAGVAVGAGHYAVAVELLKPVFEKNPNDPMLASMLSEAQMQSFDYEGAGATLKAIAEMNENDAEAYFNLARFHLTADYNPDLVRSYAKYAASLRPDDTRNEILLGLADYTEGKINEGIRRIKELLPNVTDPGIKGICQHLIADGENASLNGSRNFAALLALPGAKHANPTSLRFSGEDALKEGSYFTAIDRFTKANEKAEIGRAYLGIASALTSAGETELAATAAGYGMKLLNEEIASGKNVARASLYTALYYNERGDKDSAMNSVTKGLTASSMERSTYNKLVTLYDSLI